MKELEKLDAEWGLLARHAERGAVVVVHPELDLMEVARRVADDDAAQVAEWISGQRLAKPTQAQLNTWNSEPSRKFLAVIVQPYVLIQVLSQ